MRLIYLNTKQALRNLRKNIWQTAIAVTGLVIGLVCLTFSANWWWNDTHYDSFRPHYNQLYLVQTVTSFPHQDTTFCVRYTSVSYPAWQAIRNCISDIGDAVLFAYKSNTMVYIYDDGREIDEDLVGETLEATPDLPPLMGLKTLYGNVDKALQTPDHLVLKASVARRIFGTENAVGRSFVRKNIYRPDDTAVCTVGAVVADEPEQTNIDFGVMQGWPGPRQSDNGWGELNYKVLIRTSHPEAVTAQLKRIEAPQGRVSRAWNLVPLRLAHTLGEEPVSDYWRVYLYPVAFTAVSLLLLLSALFNLIAVYTAVFIARLREYKLRISLGAVWRQNTGWLGTELALVLVLACAVSLVAVELMVYWGGIDIAAVGIYRSFGLVTLGLVAGTGVGLLYPLMQLRRLYRSLLSGRQASRHVSLSLLLVQLAVCALMAFVFLNVYRQLDSLFTRDLGFDTRNILRLDTRTKMKYYEGIFYPLRDALRVANASSIVDAVALDSDVFDRMGTQGYLGGHLGDGVPEEGREAGFSFIYLPVSAGRFFGLADHGSQWCDTIADESAWWAVANQKFYDSLHLPVGTDARLTFQGAPLHLMGVARIRTCNYRQNEGAVLFVCTPEHMRPNSNTNALYVKHRPGCRAEAEAAMRRTLRDFDVPEEAVSIQSMDEYILSRYETERRLAAIFLVITVASLVITFLGVLSMFLYTLRVQRKPLAVRRIFGATFSDLCRQYLRGYVVLVAVACAVSWPLGMYALRYWLDGFTERVDVGWPQMLYILGGLQVLVVGIVTVQVRRVMRENPADVVRSE